MASSRFGCALALSLILASPAFAYRREYSVTLDGVRKSGSEVCFYGGKSAASPFALFFSYDRVACLAADKVLDLPPGLFHAFARHAEGYVSGYRDFFVYEGPAVPERGYQMLEIPLERSAYADVSAISASLQPGQTIGVWLAPAPGGSDTFFPLVDGESSIMLPAGRPFVPLVVANGRPVAIGDPHRLSAGERRRITIAPAPRGTTDVVVWLNFDPSQRELINRLPPPEITLEAGGEPWTPALPLEGVTTHSLVIFKRVPVGPAQIKAGGPRWVRYARELIASFERVSVESEALLLTAGAALDVTWNLGDAPTIAEECKNDGQQRPRLIATLHRCTDVNDPASCHRIEQSARDLATSGAVRFEGIPPGSYRVSLQGPFGKAVHVDATLAAGDEASLVAPIRAFSFFGTVTINAEPTAARLSFATGEVQSDGTGRYTATLTGDPSTNLITISTCEEGRSFRYIPDRRITENGAYDIALRIRPVRVLVLDDRGAPVAGASVKVSPVKGMDGTEAITFYGGRPAQTDERGRAEDANVPVDNSVVVCATHPRYSTRCTEPLTPSALDHQVVVRFRGNTLRGRVVGHAGDGVLALVDAAGRLTEQVVLAPDGTFAFQNDHVPTGYYAYTSSLKPLTVAPLPQAAGANELLLSLPAAPVRSFTVSIPAMTTQSGVVGVWIDGRYVPLDILSLHHDLRGRESRVTRGTELAIVDLAETGPIELAYAPEIAGAGAFADPFTLPQYAGVNRHRVIGAAITLPTR